MNPVKKAVTFEGDGFLNADENGFELLIRKEDNSPEGFMTCFCNSRCWL